MADDQTLDAMQSNAHMREYRRHLALEEQKARERRKQTIIDHLIKEEIVPIEAEIIAAISGLSPFEGQHWPATMGDAYWPLAFAVLWVAWRDPTRMDEQWGRFRTWSGHLWRDPRDGGQVESLQDAESQIWRALEAGSVHAVGMPYQETDYVEVPSVQWRNLKWMPGTSKISVRNFAQTDARYRCVDVASSDVLKLWPLNGTESSEAGEITEPPTVLSSAGAKRGRKPDPEVDRFWIEIVKATLSGRYESQRALKSHMETWAERNGCTYDLETIRKKVGALYREMNWREGSPD